MHSCICLVLGYVQGNVGITPWWLQIPEFDIYGYSVWKAFLRNFLFSSFKYQHPRMILLGHTRDSFDTSMPDEEYVWMSKTKN